MTIYMKMEGIEGDVTAKGHENWIALRGYSFSTKRLISTNPGRIADREGTRPNMSEIKLTKRVDKCSPLLFSESCVGRAKSQVTVDICQTADSLSAYSQLILSNVIISGYEFGAEAAEYGEQHRYPGEIIYLSFDKLEFRYTPYDNENQPQSPITAGYDLRQAIAV